MAALVCPKCGRESNKIEFIEAFCIQCYPVKIKSPDKMMLERCKRCDRMHLKGEWVPYNERRIEENIISKCRGDFSDAVYDFSGQKLVFTVNKNRVERGMPLNRIITICQQCSRISGGYYQAIIQLRGERPRIEKYAHLLMEKLAVKTFVAKTEEKDEGLDIYAGNSKAVVNVITSLGIRALITKKLVGRDQGKRLYRTTFAIRL